MYFNKDVYQIFNKYLYIHLVPSFHGLVNMGNLYVGDFWLGQADFQREGTTAINYKNHKKL